MNTYSKNLTFRIETENGRYFTFHYWEDKASYYAETLIIGNVKESDFNKGIATFELKNPMLKAESLGQLQEQCKALVEQITGSKADLSKW